MAFLYHSNFRAGFRPPTLYVAMFATLSAITCPLMSGQVPSPAGTQLVSDSGLKAPAGSYQLSCLILDVGASNLRAICQTISGDWQTTELRNPDRCPADISNENGKLTCSRGSKVELPDASLDPLGYAGLQPFQRLSRSEPANLQLEYDTWTFKDGAPATVTVAQTTDGFLWLGNTGGLYRFDGKQFELFHSPFGQELLSTNISCLYAPPSGGLWIAYRYGGMGFLDKGRLKNYGDLATSTGTISLMVQDKDGIVWAVGVSSGLWRFDHSRWQHIGMEWNVPLRGANEVALDRDGNLWVGGGGMLLSLRRGSRTFEIVKDNLPLDAKRFDSTRRLVDREGNIWFASDKGLDRFFYSFLIKQNIEGPQDRFALAPEDDGKILVAGLGSTLYRIDRKGREPPETSWLGDIPYLPRT